MNTLRPHFYITSLATVLVLTVFSVTLVPIIALVYSYNTMCTTFSVVGFLILSAESAFLWLYRRRTHQTDNVTVRRAVNVGIFLGLLWVAEISINNFIAPPLPARDIIDNIFWAIIALVIFALSIFAAYRTDSFSAGLEFGVWSGLVSGTLPCWMALSLIVFGMHFITQDPLNISEWATRRADSGAPTIAAYFAYETFAGAFSHLIVLGIVMGCLLGSLGGSIWKISKIVWQPNK